MNRINTAAILRHMAFPVALSLSMGLLVVSDSMLASYHPLWQLALDHEIAHNYLWTASVIFLLIVIAVGSNYRVWLFIQRYRVATVMMITAPALGGINLIRLDPPDFAMVLATIFWLTTVMVEDRPVLVPRVIIALMLGLVGFTVGSIATNGIGTIFALPSVMSKLMVVFLLANLIATPRDHTLVLKILIAVAVVSAGIAIFTESLYLLTGITLTFDDRADEHFKCFGWICLFRATGLTPTPQVLGHLLIMGLGLALFLQLRLWLHLLIIVALLVGAVATLSVGVILTVSVVLVLFPIFRWPSRYLHILTAYATAAWISHVTGLWAWVYWAANDLLLASEGVNIRVWTYRGGAELIEKSPVFGIGALNQIPGSMHFTTPHNTYLQVALEMGLPAAFIFLSLLIYLFVSCWRIAARAEDADTRRWMRGLLLGFSGMLVHFISEPMYPNNLPWTYMGLVTAGIIVYGRTRTDPQWSAICQATPRAHRVARTLRNAGHFN